MDYKERLQEAFDHINFHRGEMNEAMNMFIYNLTDLLWPCGEHGCLVGTEDYCDDIYYVYAEPKPNEFYRVTAIRNKDGHLEVRLDLERNTAGDFSDYGFDKDGWMDFNKAHIADLAFLADEVKSNLEYSDGYQPEDEDEFEFLIDEDGSKYNPEISILSGGMDIRCDYNEEALFAYKTRKSLPEITAYLLSKGWVKTHENTYHEFRKGNTACFFDDWREETGEFVCFGTEYKTDAVYTEEDIKALAELKRKLDGEEKPMKRYAVPFLRTQWADVVVEADSRDEAILKAENIFNEGHDGDIEWEDIDGPEYDDVRGVDIYPYND